jgi:uncharacterized protein YydD (DUF2326 family)
MPKVSNMEIYQAKEAISELSKEKFHVSTSYSIAKLMNSLKGQLEVIEQVRLNLIRKYGVEKDGQISIEPNSENFQKFYDEMNIILSKEVDINYEKICLPDDFIVEPNKILALGPFIEI